MCGICGFVGGPAVAGADAVIEAMSDAIAHRGPDGFGSHPINGGDAVQGRLGHRRLRILDLTRAADQPMVAGDRPVALTFNGEIYNFGELRRELAALGHPFRSTGDTEVVLRAYVQWGRDALRRLEGMFALAVWDAREGRLLLARDRAGKKPLFYSLAGGRLTFASEVKALARAPWIDLRPDFGALAPFLVHGYVPGAATFYEGIREVPPAGWLEFDPSSRALAGGRFWSSMPIDFGLPPTAAVGSIRELLERAVAGRLAADVPLGVLLSGGVDSSVVTALVMRQAGRPVRTFSVGLPDQPSFDEREQARAVARRLGAVHTELSVRGEATELLDRLVWLHDGPFGDSSAVPTYLVCAGAREHVTVVLTGDGGDETFAGYQRFAAAALARPLGPHSGRWLSPAVGLLPGGDDFYAPRRRAARFVDALALPFAERYLDWTAVFRPSEVARLTGDPAAARDVTDAFIDSFHSAGGLPPIDRLLQLNFSTYLPGDLLVKLDRASMAHSLEARSPMLDTALVELAMRVPARHKVGFRAPKPLLRAAGRDLLPASVWRRPKHGFGVPVDRWFREELGDVFADEVIAPGGLLRDVLAPAELNRLLHEHRAGAAENGARLWALLTLERWLADLARPEPLREPAEAAVIT